MAEETLLFENGEFMFRPNFTGRAGKFNAEGEREITIKIKEEDVDNLRAQGWNIKRSKGEDGTPGTGPAYLPVDVKFEFKPPRIVQITSRGPTVLDEDLVQLIDAADIKFWDAIVRAYDYDFNGNQGRKAYLKTFFVTIEEDYLEMKYADIMYNLSSDDGDDEAER